MSKKTISFLIFLTFLIIYYASSFSKISFGDCIGFVLDVERREFLTDFMPLTHFLYINFAVFFSKFLNIDSVLVMRLMSVVPAALTVSAIFILIKEFVKENWIAVASSFVFGFGFTFWRSAATVEVYAFNAIWVILFLVCSIKSLRNKSEKAIILAGVFLGLSLWVHIQNIMLIPAYIYLLYLLRSERRGIILSLIFFASLFFVMFLVNHLQGIDAKYVFTSKKGRWVQSTFEQSLLDHLKNMMKAIAFLIYNFNVFILFSVGGVIHLYKNFKTEAVFLFIAAAFTLGFATFYAVSDNYVYFIPFYLVFAVFIAVGIKKLNMKFSIRRLRFAPVLIPFFYVCCLWIVSLLPHSKDFQNKKAYKGGLHYYMLPWLHNNIGCIEFTLDNGTATDNVEALKEWSNEFIKMRKEYQTLEAIRKL